MKYSIGDLFVSCNKLSVRYIESITCCCWYNMTHIDDVLKCRFPNVTETNIDMWITDGAWEHFPIKKDNKSN